jgi:hypothetical protein
MKLTFVSKVGSSPAVISAIDELGTVSSWSVMEIQAHIAEKQENNDPNLNIGGRFKLLENYSKDMMYEPEIMEHSQTPEGFPIHDVTQSMYLEADPKDSNVFYFSSTNALFKCDRRVSNEPVRLDTTGLGAVSCLSMSDN